VLITLDITYGCCPLRIWGHKLSERENAKGGEMTQTLYAHMNKRKKREKKMHFYHRHISRILPFILTFSFLHIIVVATVEAFIESTESGPLLV
jgi:hypothetical protein